MLPTGHIAAGFLTAYSIVKIARPDLELSQINQLLFFGAFFGFAPDLDEFYVFAKSRSWLVASETTSLMHRKFFSHTPVLWVLGGLIIFLFTSGFIKLLGLIILFSSLSHFLLDSIEHGIMWLWPFSSKVYALKDAGFNFLIKEKNFFKHSFQFLQIYTTRLSFYLEVLIILVAIFVSLNL